MSSRRVDHFPSRIVIDSSVVVKWFVSDSEAGVAAALALLVSHGRGDVVLAAPSLLLLEVVNALRCRSLAPATLVSAAERLLETGIELHEPAELLAGATALATRHGLTLYDAAFAELARQLDTELVTADRRLAEAGACRIRFIG
jgi:predicted nucleic acid-binding protein